MALNKTHNMGFLRNLLGLGPKVNIKELVANGATVIDVRTKEEFNAGHAKGSKNIPLEMIGSQMKKLSKMNQPIITCCRSGMRSGQAARMLRSNGLEAHNAGSWTRLR